MTTARLVPLPSPITSAPDIRIEADRIVIEHLVLCDAALAAYVGQREADDRLGVVERALKIGLTALQDAGVSVNVDVVRREFEGLLRQTEAANERAATALDQVLRANFGDGDGRLPRTLERFLGDRGALRTFVGELFDPAKRDSAIGRMQLLLGQYFDGDASRLAQLLDPTRLGSPLHQFRSEVADGFARLGERLSALELATGVRERERARGTAKGGDFEDLVDELLGEIARGSGDLCDRTGTEAGAVVRSKKGDFVLSLDPSLTSGADLRVVVECKDRPVSGREMRDELRQAKENRSAAVGLVIFTPEHAPRGIEPFDVRAGDVYCVLDPTAPDRAALEGAVRLARLHALASLRERDVDVDAAAIREALTGIREQLETVRGMKATLTSMSNGARDVQAGLDRLRDGVIARVAEAEAELRVVGGARDEVG